MLLKPMAARAEFVWEDNEREAKEVSAEAASEEVEVDAVGLGREDEDEAGRGGREAGGAEEGEVVLAWEAEVAAAIMWASSSELSSSSSASPDLVVTTAAGLAALVDKEGASFLVAVGRLRLRFDFSAAAAEEGDAVVEGLGTFGEAVGGMGERGARSTFAPR
jgi:hypothetical protein